MAEEKAAPEEPKAKTGEYTQKDIDDNKVMAALSYLGLLVLIPLLAAKESKYAQFHANQGLILLIANIAVYFVAVTGSVLTLGLLGIVLIPAAWIFVVVFSILGIVNAVGGEAKQLPLIGGYKILK